jgi:hypothetical protein
LKNSLDSDWISLINSYQPREVMDNIEVSSELINEDVTVNSFNEKDISGPFFVYNSNSFAISDYYPNSRNLEHQINDKLSNFLYGLKYKNKYEYTAVFAEAIVWFVNKANITSYIDYIVPCPSGRVRERQPMMEIAQRASKILNIPYLDILKKNDYSTGKSREERRIVAEKIHMKRNVSLTQKRILLLDDVITSGYTMNFSKQQILKCGAMEIVCLSIFSTKNNFSFNDDNNRSNLLNIEKISFDLGNKSLVECILLTAKNRNLVLQTRSREIMFNNFSPVRKDDLIQEEEYIIEKPIPLVLEIFKKEVLSNNEFFINQSFIYTTDILLYAIEIRNYQIIRLITESKTIKYDDSIDLLFRAVEEDVPIDILLTIIESYHSNTHKKALIIAVNKGDLKTVKTFLELGFNPRIRDSIGDTMWVIARRKGFEKIQELFPKMV